MKLDKSLLYVLIQTFPDWKIEHTISNKSLVEFCLRRPKNRAFRFPNSALRTNFRSLKFGFTIFRFFHELFPHKSYVGPLIYVEVHTPLQIYRRCSGFRRTRRSTTHAL